MAYANKCPEGPLPDEHCPLLHRTASVTYQLTENVAVTNENAVTCCYTLRNSRRVFTHLAYSTYFCIYGFFGLLSYQYIYYRVSQSYANITRGDYQCKLNVSDDVMKTEIEVHTTTSRWVLNFSIATGVPSVISVLIIGSMSDRFGRRILYAIPNAGLMISCIIFGVSSRFNLQLEVLYAAYLINGLCGSFVTILVGAASSAADTTSTSTARNLQMVAIKMFSSFSAGIPIIISGFMISSFGYAISCYVLTGLCALNFIFICLILETSPEIHEPKTIVEYVQNMFSFYYKYSSKRAIYRILIVTFLLEAIVFVGRGAMDTLYYKDFPFCWSSIDLGMYEGILHIVYPILALIQLRLMQRHFSDSMMCAIGCLIAFSGFLIQGFATANIQVMPYLGGVLQYTSILIVPLIRSIVSKLTPRHQQGVALSSLAAVEALVLVIGGVTFNAIYEVTLSAYRGSVFFFMAAILLVCVITYLVLHKMLKGDEYYVSIK